MKNFEMAFGIMFQEYHIRVDPKTLTMTAKLIRIFWVVTAMFMSMALTGNLKSTLVRGRYEKRTMTINEIIDKDMTLHITDTMESYLSSGFTDSNINTRMLCQARKKSSISPFNA